jgi:hypothetical protein
MITILLHEKTIHEIKSKLSIFLYEKSDKFKTAKIHYEIFNYRILSARKG